MPSISGNLYPNLKEEILALAVDWLPGWLSTMYVLKQKSHLSTTLREPDRSQGKKVAYIVQCDTTEYSFTTWSESTSNDQLFMVGKDSYGIPMEQSYVFTFMVGFIRWLHKLKC